MIYFVQGEHTRRIKIGFTAGFIHTRIRALQTGSPDKLIFIGACPGSKHTENELHFMFREFHSHNEWFDDAPELNSYINEYCIHDIKITHEIDALVSTGKEKYKFLLTLSSQEIRQRYARLLVKQLEQSDLGRRQIATIKRMSKTAESP